MYEFSVDLDTDTDIDTDNRYVCRHHIYSQRETNIPFSVLSFVSLKQCLISVFKIHSILLDVNKVSNPWNQIS